MRPLSRAELRAALTDRRPDDHKGTYGHALIVAGSRNMAGAAILATRAALRSGAGLVTLAVPATLQPRIAGFVPEALTLGLPENAHGSLRPEAAGRLKAAHKERRFDAMALGCGISRHPDTAKLVVALLDALAVPAVVDADALNLLSEQDPAAVGQLLRARAQPCVVTPHPGEAGRCLRETPSEVNADREGAARRLAREWGCVVALKGRRTVIATADKAVFNATGGPGLAKGGTGDALTGLLAGLWAQRRASARGAGEEAFTVAALGAHLHGLAGDLAEKDLGPFGMTAQDVIDRLPLAFVKL